ncbi:MAG: UDP-N-acetylmuramate dehydrogenase [Rhodospirillales bacterium]|nr:UDP-N-acetylmuramate dehydrogenase [Rhodospirillales bacterium]USO08237.1 MAG: UDP-N-acetylmuramate dehydrogenase [Rhodospirillales bacterium]
MSDLAGRLPKVRGRYTADAPLGATTWFRCGGNAQMLFKPEDEADLSAFLSGLPDDVPVTVLGVCSNTIVRDGGIPGVVIRLGGAFADIAVEPDSGAVRAGAAALDANVAAAAGRAGRAGLEFLSGIPGTVGGALRMNAGAYGAEIKDVLIEARGVDRAGQAHAFDPAGMGLGYRHCSVPEDVIFTGARLRTIAGDPTEIAARMRGIKDQRQATQPQARTGGSTFANPTADALAALGLEPMKAWQMIDKAGCRGLKIGGAQMAELHCNFMINTGDATSSDLEALGEEVRRRVKDLFGYELRWEIRRIGVPADMATHGQA